MGLETLATLTANVGTAQAQTGYGIEMIPSWPTAPSAVTDTKQFEANVDALWTHTWFILQSFLQPGVARVEFKIGKTSVAKHAQRKAFLSSDWSTWRYGSSGDSMSPAKRFQKYKTDRGYHALIVLACFSHADVPPVCLANQLSQQHLALSYEAALDVKAAAAPPTPGFQMATGDGGGGGRAVQKAYAGALVYVAIKIISK